VTHIGGTAVSEMTRTKGSDIARHEEPPELLLLYDDDDPCPVLANLSYHCPWRHELVDAVEFGLRESHVQCRKAVLHMLNCFGSYDD